MADPISEAAARKGSAELLILAALEDGQLHGYEIATVLTRFNLPQILLTFHVASLYPLLYRLEDRRWISGRWVEKPGQRRRRCYRLTAEGKRVLASHRSRWSSFVNALTKAAGLRHA